MPAALEAGVEGRRDPGGGLLILTIDDHGEVYRVPLLTHVEDTPSILAGIEKILSDAPDSLATSQLADLRRRVEQWAPSDATETPFMLA